MLHYTFQNGFVLVLDVGLHTSKLISNNRTYLEIAKECAIAYIEQKVFKQPVVHVLVCTDKFCY